MSALPKQRTVFVVSRAGWIARESHCSLHESLAGVPIAVFSTREDAEAFRAELDAERRRETNPFSLGEVYGQRETQLRALIERWKLPLPVAPETGARPSHITAWERWWDEHAGKLTEEQKKEMVACLGFGEYYQIFETVMEL